MKNNNDKLIKAKLLKDLTYISVFDLKNGEIIFITHQPDNTNWVIDPKSNNRIKLFTHEFEVI
jgi:hypothetical protein